MTDQETAPGPLAEPIEFGPYELLQLLGSGVHSEVYLARTRGIEGFARQISLRCLRNSDGASPDVISEFVEQAKRASALQHANIAQVLDLGKVNGTYYVAAEYVTGPSLAALTKEVGDPLPAAIAVHLAVKVLEALEYAHNRTDEAGHSIELLHSGIAPDDVAVSEDGQVKLLTFGAGGASRSGPGSVGVQAGRIGYMSPEQVRGLALDRRSDTFAVGVILHEMLAGKRLFKGDTEFEVLEKIRKVEVTPPSLLNSNITPELEDLVLKSLDRSPANRFQTANHMARELQKWAISADAFLNDADVRAFVSEVMPNMVARSAPEPAPETAVPKPALIDHGLDWDDEEIETALFARHDGMIPRPSTAPEPDEELGAWSRGHATGVRPRPKSASGSLPAAENADLGELPERRLPSQEVPAIGNLASAGASTSFDSAVEEILRAESGEEAAVSPDAAANEAEEHPRPEAKTSEAPAMDSREDVVSAYEPQRQRGLVWLVGVAALVLVGLVGVVLSSPGPSPTSLQVALTPMDLEYTLLIDGTVVYEGRVPTALTDIAEGTHQLTVRADGYVERTDFVEIGAEGTALVDWEIMPIPVVTVPFNSVPTGATVVIDGVAQGETPIEVVLIVGATVDVELQLAGHDSHATSFIVTEPSIEITVALTAREPGATAEVPINAAPESAAYVITSQPSGEVVARGQTPATATLEIGGNYSVSLQAEGFEGALTPLVNTADGFEPFRAVLRPAEDANAASDSQADIVLEGADTEQEPDEEVEEEPIADPREEQPVREEVAAAIAAPAEIAEPDESEAEQAEQAEAERNEAQVRQEERERVAAREEREARLREEAEAVAEPTEGPPGFINVQSSPPATIIIDGTDTGLTTPVNGIPLSSGIRHRVELVNEAAGLHRTYRVSLDPGQVRNIVNRSP